MLLRGNYFLKGLCHKITQFIFIVSCRNVTCFASAPRVYAASSLAFTRKWFYLRSSSAASNTMSRGYKEAITALNGLQTNAAVLHNIQTQGDRAHMNIPATIKYLGRAGITLEQLDKLAVIHVTGTKGKGSTCAFTERILREHGYKTGLYTSPHLISVTERIRLNGQSIVQDDYTKYFWQVYDDLYRQREYPSDMPAYFRFLTVLALKVFLEECVDIAILEVGIGGEYDCTNVIRNPVACAITALDLDHTSLLGNTLASIAWHKAGIIKRGAEVFTVEGHHPDAMAVLERRAAEKQCVVRVVPPLLSYDWRGRALQLGLSGPVQLSNASLALQLAHCWIASRHAARPYSASTHDAATALPSSSNTYVNGTATSTINNSVSSTSSINSSGSSAGTVNSNVASTSAINGTVSSNGVCDTNYGGGGSSSNTAVPCSAFVLSEEDLVALREVVWPGRSQVLQLNDRVTVFLDGAHTNNSMDACAAWFLNIADLHCQTRHRGHRMCRVLVFNSTGDRNSTALLSRLHACGFDLAVFTTNIASRNPQSSDQTNLTVSEQSQHLRCQRHLEAWQFMAASRPASPRSAAASVSPPEQDTCGPRDASTTGSPETTSSLAAAAAESQEITASSHCSHHPRSSCHPELSLPCHNNQISQSSLHSVSNSLPHSSSPSPPHPSSPPCSRPSSPSFVYTTTSSDLTHMLQFTQASPDFSDNSDAAPAVTIPYIQDALEWLLGAVSSCAAQPPPASGGLYSRVYCIQNDKLNCVKAEDPPPSPAVLVQADHVQVLVTGSLHLVGGVLAVLTPDLASAPRQTLADQVRQSVQTCISTPGAP